MSKTLWHTITIKVPAEMVEMTKAGKVSIKKTLTKTLNISKSNKKPSIKLVPANVKAPEIVNNGKEWNVEELKKSMSKAKALSIKNKDRDIFESKDPFKNKNKFEATVAKRAKELVKIKKDKDAAKKAEELEKIKIADAPKQEENYDSISGKLQHLLFIKGIDKTKKALTKLNYNGRLHTNPMLRTAQIVQNFNTIPKMKQLIKELESDI